MDHVNKEKQTQKAYLTVNIAVISLLTFATLKKIFSPVMTQRHKPLVHYSYSDKGNQCNELDETTHFRLVRQMHLMLLCGLTWDVN